MSPHVPQPPSATASPEPRVKNLATKGIDSLVILMVYGAARPSDREWGTLLRTIQRHGGDATAHLIFTAGGAPSPAQRRDFNKLFDGHAIPLAVMAAGGGLRLSLWTYVCYGRQVRPFPPSDVREALASLAVPANRIDDIARELGSLREQVHGAARSAL